MTKEELMKEELIEELNGLNLKKLNEHDIDQKIYEIEAIVTGSKEFVMD
ncbi:hypothetical protein [Clostridium kluyveri]|nr:hypothetical protein [Clostridium kluyveri]UZQ49890.1 hypothetical protein OP486_18370 [Clostridium kluyveri]